MGALSAHGASSSLADVAEKAFRAGLFDEAEKSYRQLLPQVESAKQEPVLLRLVEIAVRRGDWENAQVWLGWREWAPSAEKEFWRAQVEVGLGQVSPAETLLSRFLERHPEHDLALPASLTLASLQLDQDEHQKAAGTLQRWEMARGVDLDFLRARVALAAGQHREAINYLERLRQNPAGLSLDRQTSVFFDLGRARLAEKQAESSEAVMRSFLETYPESPHTSDALHLIQLAGGFDTAEQRAEWEIWSKRFPSGLQNELSFHLGLVEAGQGRYSQAIQQMEAIESGHRRWNEAAARKAGWLLKGGNVTACLAFLSEVDQRAGVEGAERGELLFIRGRALVELGRLSKAHEAFLSCLSSPVVETRVYLAAFNALVTEPEPSEGRGLVEGVPTSSALQGLLLRSLPSSEASGEELLGEALFQRALVWSRGVESDLATASAALERLLAEFPEHKKAAQARVMKVELDLMNGRAVVSLDGGVPSGDTLSDARLAYLAIWEAAGKGEWGRVIQLGEAFLGSHPGDPLVASVRFRRAEAHLVREAYSAAQREVALVDDLVRNEAGIALQAAFLRAWIAQQRGDLPLAVKAWNEVMGLSDGEDLLVARHQQALVLCQQGKRAEALAQWNEVLNHDVESEFLARVLLSKGECLTLMADQDSDRGAEALVALQRVVDLPRVRESRKEEAIFRSGVVHQRLNAHTEALTAFNQLLRRYRTRLGTEGEEITSDGVQTRPSPKWYYRAGFEAVTLLEMRKQWEAAARLADELASVPGERSREAAQRAAQIRVRHFIW